MQTANVIGLLSSEDSTELPDSLIFPDKREVNCPFSPFRFPLLFHLSIWCDHLLESSLQDSHNIRTVNKHVRLAASIKRKLWAGSAHNLCFIDAAYCTGLYTVSLSYLFIVEFRRFQLPQLRYAAIETLRQLSFLAFRKIFVLVFWKVSYLVWGSVNFTGFWLFWVCLLGLFIHAFWK